jgi:20S proteasome subunit beta 4
VRGITVLNQTDDKSRTLNQHNLLIFAGDSGDTIHFAEYIQANVQLYGMKNDTELNSDAVAAFTRREMADNLRTRVVPQVWLIVASVPSIDDSCGMEHPVETSNVELD